ncbi:putative manganese transporter [Salinimonas lutimaris]|uniref:putative manganese transporter n=1 Tax=Salinimonas lutimaris TaxID=914153 RepID=UPI0010C13FFF|nr:putative manganese transporter [Salinimonas lutimaris]
MGDLLTPLNHVKTAARANAWVVNKRLFLPAIVLVLMGVPVSREATLQILSDAYFQVAAFVYASLALYYIATHRVDPEAVGEYMRSNPAAEIGLAAFLGVLPGCGGAIIVVTQYTKGVTSFGAVVAVLVSTMGDAAFLLLAQAPSEAAVVLSISFVAGTMTGLVVNRFHNFVPASVNNQNSVDSHKNHSAGNDQVNSSTGLADVSVTFWLLVALPSLAIAMLLAFQVNVAALLNITDSTFLMVGASLGFVSIMLWALSSEGTDYTSVASEDCCPAPVNWQQKAALDTQFVLAWVVAAFLVFEMTIVFLGIDVAAQLQTMGPAVVGLAILIGFLPGCGPQILVTSLYLTGAVPFSALLGNAISNDGDALFPALALSPKAAMLATVYSAMPAIVIGYGYYFLFEI